jgi:hypothetical protein
MENALSANYPAASSYLKAQPARAALGDPDTYWHIAIGRWIIAHREVPRFDVFSFSMPGAPFTPPEWLAELGIAWLYDRFGWGR